MKTLSIQRPRPSIEMHTPAPCSRPVNRGEVNWLPWMPFCVSSGNWELIDLAAALADEGKDLACDVAFNAANGLEF